MARYDVIASLCFIVGSLLLAQNMGWIGNVGQGWPLTVTLAGVALIIGGVGRGRYGKGAIGAGVYLLLTSGLFMYLNITSWNMMADLWPLFIGFLGVSIFASGVGGRRNRVIIFLSVFFVLVSLSFFLIFTIDPKLWPVSLFCLGLSLIFLGRIKDEKTNSNN